MKATSRYTMIAVVAAASVAAQMGAVRADHTDKDKNHTTANRASEIIGMEVRNNENEKLGKVEDLIVNLGAGHVSYAILSMGGVLGIGDKLVLVPVSEFVYGLSDKKLVLNTSKDVLKNAPRFEKGKWPDLNDPQWDADAHTYYKGKIKTYSTDVDVDNTRRKVRDRDTTDIDNNRRVVRDSDGADVDNTRRNVRDRDGATLLPGDQGNSEADRTTTQQIRKALVKDSGLSMVAKNVKIITVNGNVTLRGVVKTEQERNDIIAKAKQVAGVTEVNNQLEVKTQ